MTSERQPALVLGLSVVGVTLALLVRPDGSLMDYFSHALNVTAWLSFVFFIAAYAARPLMRITGRGRWLVSNRRYLGLSAALVHTVHFGYIVVWVMATGEPVEVPVLILGGGAFVLLWLMALTSNDVAVRVLGGWWKTLHRAGLHYLWVVYVYTFAGGAVSDPVAGGFAALGIAAALLRLAAWRTQRVRRTG